MTENGDDIDVDSVVESVRHAETQVEALRRNVKKMQRLVYALIYAAMMLWSLAFVYVVSWMLVKHLDFENNNDDFLFFAEYPPLLFWVGLLVLIFAPVLFYRVYSIFKKGKNLYDLANHRYNNGMMMFTAAYRRYLQPKPRFEEILRWFKELELVLSSGDDENYQGYDFVKVKHEGPSSKRSADSLTKPLENDAFLGARKVITRCNHSRDPVSCIWSTVSNKLVG